MTQVLHRAPCQRARKNAGTEYLCLACIRYTAVPFVCSRCASGAGWLRLKSMMEVRVRGSSIRAFRLGLKASRPNLAKLWRVPVERVDAVESGLSFVTAGELRLLAEAARPGGLPVSLDALLSALCDEPVARVPRDPTPPESAVTGAGVRVGPNWGSEPASASRTASA
jgi:hypothetical protein